MLLAETTDPVRLSFLRSVLEAGEVETFVFGEFGPWPGSQPARIMVRQELEGQARRLILEADPTAPWEG